MDVIQEQPGGRDPAPGPLELVQAFVNTNDREGRTDKLARPDRARAWLTEQALLEPDAPLDEVGFLRLLDVREAVRALGGANNRLPLAEGVIETLTRAAATSLVVEFTQAGAVLRPAGTGVDRAIGRLLAAVDGAMRDGSWVRMKACRRDACRWLFYDHSRNRSSSWCSMSVCGNRSKTRAYRRRRQGA